MNSALTEAERKALEGALKVDSAAFSCLRNHPIHTLDRCAAWVEVDGQALVMITCPTCDLVELRQWPRKLARP